MKNDIKRYKKEFRQRIKALIKNLSDEMQRIQSKEVFEQIENSDDFKKAQKIAVYWSMPDELDTHWFVNKWYQNKEVYLPVIKGQEMEFVRFYGENGMVPDTKYGILEPIGNKLDENDVLDLMIIPGIAYDYIGNRLGRGGGFYDRSLLKFKKTLKIGVGFDFQLMPELFVEEFDIPVDEVIVGVKK